MRERTSVVYAVVSWNDDDPTDYLAAGWWLQFPGELSPRRRLSLSEAERSAFIDGPELDISDSIDAVWIPAFAGMTAKTLETSFPRRRESIELQVLFRMSS